MNRPLTLAAAASVLIMACGHSALAQQGGANPLFGTWTLVSATDERTDGTKVPLFGPNPVGVLMFDTEGRYSSQTCTRDRPKFAANSRAKGTAEENQAIVQGCNTHWGHYLLNPADKFILFKIEHGLYPNWEGTEQKRPFTLTGDELRYTVPNPSAAAANPVLVWKRAK